MKHVQLTVLTSPSCTQCHRFLAFWEKEKKNWEHVVMSEVSILTEEGQSLVREHQIFASPGIIIANKLFSTGGYDEEQFRERLREESGE